MESQDTGETSAPVQPIVSQRFWVSWVCTSTDPRPLLFPPHKEICGWWRTGFNADDNVTICAVVDAESESHAAAAVFRDWPEAELYVNEFGWRFIEPRDRDWKPGDRFPPSEWMADRLAG